MTNNGAILLDVKLGAGKGETAFRDALPSRPIVRWDDITQRNYDLSAIRYACVWNPEDGLLARCENLEVIFSVGAGVDHIFKDPHLPDVPIVRFVDPHLTGRMVEWVTHQVFMHLRQQRAYDKHKSKKEWHELPQPAAHELRIGILGFGELGQACAKALLPFGFPVSGWSRNSKHIESVTSYAGDEQLDDFLAVSDVLVCLLPLTDATRGMLDRDLFEKLAKDGPFGAPVLINAGRGGSQVENDIAEALKSGALHGASLDVFEVEPLPVKSPLWALENCIITPHAAAISSPTALAAHVARQIERYEQGQELQHVVDRSVGY